MTYDKQFNAVWDGEEGRYQYSGGDSLAPKGEDIRNIYFSEMFPSGIFESSFAISYLLLIKNKVALRQILKP